MRNATKARVHALAGSLIAIAGMTSALWRSHRVTVAFCGVMLGSTLTLAAMTWRETRGR